MLGENETTRRRVLQSSGIAVLGGLAGCTGLLRESTEDPPTDDQPSAEDPPTETSSTEDPPTEFTDDFRQESLEPYRVLVGDRDQWGVEERIDGPSAHVTAAGAYENTLLAPRADQFRWTGTGTVTLEAQVRENNYNRNALIEFGDPDGDMWRVKVAFSGRTVKIISPTDRIESVFAAPDPGEAHRIDVSVTTDAITVSLDDEQRVQYSSPPALPSGTVAFGIGSNDSKGGQTWFDDVRLQSE